MSTFQAFIALFKTCVTRHAGQIEIPGIVAGLSESPVRVGPSNKDGNLQLGFRLFAQDDPEAVLYENRVALDTQDLRPDQNTNFRIVIDQSLLASAPLSMVVSFVYEGQYWFYEKDGSGSWFQISKDKGAVLCSYDEERNLLPYSDHLGQLFYAKGWMRVADEAFEAQFVKNVTLICERFGLQVALFFGYQYILERDPDPFGLSEKIRSVTMGKGTIADVCIELVRSEEFQKKGFAMRGHPGRIIGSWAFAN